MTDHIPYDLVKRALVTVNTLMTRGHLSGYAADAIIRCLGPAGCLQVDIMAQLSARNLAALRKCSEELGGAP